MLGEFIQYSLLRDFGHYRMYGNNVMAPMDCHYKDKHGLDVARKSHFKSLDGHDRLSDIPDSSTNITIIIVEEGNRNGIERHLC